MGLIAGPSGGKGSTASGVMCGRCSVDCSSTALGEMSGCCSVDCGSTASGEMSGRCSVDCSSTVSGVMCGRCSVDCGSTASGGMCGRCSVDCGSTASGEMSGRCSVDCTGDFNGMCSSPSPLELEEGWVPSLPPLHWYSGAAGLSWISKGAVPTDLDVLSLASGILEPRLVCLRETVCVGRGMYCVLRESTGILEGLREGGAGV